MIGDTDYWIAACSDIAYEKLSIEAVAAAYEVSGTAEQFFYAIQAAVTLKEVIDGCV